MKQLLKWLRTRLARWGGDRVFPNVPEWLTERVRGIPQTVDSADRNSVYLHAAGWVIAQYLRKDVSSPNEDPFFDYQVLDETGALSHAHINRVVFLGETLFLLRSCPGFREFCRRLRERTLRSAFFEMLAAKQFFKADFSIHARPEVGTLGEDFDFFALRDGQRVNVEVTALTAETFSENTIMNALRRKRGQLPNTAPAVIFCVMPEQWFPDPTNWNELPRIAAKFLAGTERINAVRFWAEKHVENSDAQVGALMLLTTAHANPRARMEIRNFDFFFTGKPIDAGLATVATGVGLESAIKEANSGEFFRWVDHLVPIEKSR